MQDGNKRPDDLNHTASALGLRTESSSIQQPTEEARNACPTHNAGQDGGNLSTNPDPMSFGSGSPTDHTANHSELERTVEAPLVPAGCAERSQLEPSDDECRAQLFSGGSPISSIKDNESGPLATSRSSNDNETTEASSGTAVARLEACLQTCARDAGLTGLREKIGRASYPIPD